MATINSDLTINWGILQSGTPNIEFWYPADTPSNNVRIYHGISNNVSNRNIIKTVRMGVSAGGVHNFRNIGYDDELIKLDIVLATKEEADGFTNFFNNVIKGSANVFYYRNNFTGQESIVRSMKNTLPMGESEGHPYSFSLLLRKEDPYTTKSLSIKYDVIQTIIFPILIAGHVGNFSMVLYPTNSYRLLVTGNNNGQLGLGDGVDRYRFEQVGVATNWVSGSGGEVHSHVINESGDLFSSGINNYGQLGLGDTATRNIFTQIGSDSWSVVSSGTSFSAAIKSDGTLWAWGQNTFGQLGQGSFDSNPHSSPLQIGIGTDWADVKCGSSFLIAKKSDGTLWGCGWDGSGQLGQGSTALRRTSLVQIGVATDWGTFDAGWSHTVALKSDGALWAWGANSYGQLGDGTIIDKYVPTLIGSSTWKVISAAGQSNGTSYGIKTVGTLWAWGFNQNYELGIGSADSNPHSSPILIASGDWADVSGGGSHSLASKADNDIWGWGWNGRGEIGLGHENVVTIPTKTFLTGKSLSLLWDIELGGPPPPP